MTTVLEAKYHRLVTSILASICLVIPLDPICFPIAQKCICCFQVQFKLYEITYILFAQCGSEAVECPNMQCSHFKFEGVVSSAAEAW